MRTRSSQRIVTGRPATIAASEATRETVRARSGADSDGPRGCAVGAGCQHEQRDHRNGTHRPGEPAPGTTRGAGGRWHVPVAVVLLDELAEAEVGVLGPRRDAPAARAGDLAARAQHELELGCEEDDERHPERHELAEPLDEQPRDDEADRGDADDELCSVPVDHATTVVAT